MLITVYQLRHGRYIPVREHYYWRVPLLDELEGVEPARGRAILGVPGKIPCPGCGRVLSRPAIRYEHQCSGEITDRPVDNNRYLRNRKWFPEIGEPDPEGCPPPRDLRSVYNQFTNAAKQTERTIQRAQNPSTVRKGRPRRTDAQANAGL